MSLGENRMGNEGVMVLLAGLLGEVMPGESSCSSQTSPSPFPPSPLSPSPHPTLNKLNLSGNLLTSSTPSFLLSLLQKHEKRREGGGGRGRTKKTEVWEVLDLRKNHVFEEKSEVLNKIREYVGALVVDSGSFCSRTICDGVQEI
uniref:Uncharacterized protein n=1 Tax=Paramoeba aestuarina TaxID=180227 RepID=A0A7S4KHI0_9EUKA